jgi:hypothetical protein
MKEQFHPKFLKFVVLASRQSVSYGKWIDIPAGAPDKDGDKAPTEMMTSIKVKFPQNNYDTCLLKSVASGLNFLKKYVLANFFSSVAKKFVATPVNLQLKFVCEAAESGKGKSAQRS